MSGITESENYMFTITRTFTRPNTDVPWHHQVLYTVGLLNIEEGFRVAGKLLLKDVSLSQDGLSLTFTRYWSDLASWEEFKNMPDVVSFWAERDEYYITVGVTAGEFVITEVQQ